MTHAGLAESNEASDMYSVPPPSGPVNIRSSDRIHEILSEASRCTAEEPIAAPRQRCAPACGKPGSIFTLGHARHTFSSDPKGNNLTGQYSGGVIKGAVKGRIDGDKVQFSSSGKIEGQTLHYTYKGTVEGNKMTGTVDLGEYGQANFTATRKA